MTNFKSEFKKAYRTMRLVKFKGIPLDSEFNTASLKKFTLIANMSGASAYLMLLAGNSLYMRDGE